MTVLGGWEATTLGNASTSCSSWSLGAGGKVWGRPRRRGADVSCTPDDFLFSRCDRLGGIAVMRKLRETTEEAKQSTCSYQFVCVCEKCYGCMTARLPYIYNFHRDKHG